MALLVSQLGGKFVTLNQNKSSNVIKIRHLRFMIRCQLLNFKIRKFQRFNKIYNLFYKRLKLNADSTSAHVVLFSGFLRILN